MPGEVDAAQFIRLGNPHADDRMDGNPINVVITQLHAVTMSAVSNCGQQRIGPGSPAAVSAALKACNLQR